MIIQVNDEHPQPRKIRQAVDVLERGGIIAYPTGTVFGFGADPNNRKAIDKIYRMKNTTAKKHKPFSLLCADLTEISRFAVVPNTTYRLLKRLIPGPYTFILEATPEVPKMFKDKRRTVGIRVPEHPVTQAILTEFGKPIISTSAKLADDEFSHNDPVEINSVFPEVDMVLDTGLGGMTPSTILEINSAGEINVIREGAGPIDDLF